MLHHAAVAKAKSLISSGAVDKTSSWSFSAADGDKILGDNPSMDDWMRYGEHFLKKNDGEDMQTKAAWSYPFAKDVNGEMKVFRSGLIAVRQRAGQQNETEIFDAAGTLIDQIDGNGKQSADEPSIIEVPVIARTAQLRSFNVEDRTAEVVMSRGAQVIRQDFWGDRWIEELDMSQQAVDLHRVADGAVPFAKNHGGMWGMTIEDVMGRVMSAATDGNELTGKVKFSKRADVQPFIEDIKDNILPSVSVGYAPRKIDKVGERDGMPIMRVSQWELYELSSVAMPADSGAQFRSAQGNGKERKPQLFKCEVRGLKLGTKSNSSGASENVLENRTASNEDQKTGEENLMTEAERLAAEQAAESKRQADIKAAADAAKKEGVKLERERQAEIRKMVRAAKLDDSFGEELVKDESVTVDMARSKVIDKLAEVNASTVTRSVRVEAGNQDEQTTRREAAVEAILHRGDPAIHKLTERARQFAGMTLMEMARETLRRQGVDVSGLSRQKLAERAMHSTSDFPFITENVLSKSLRDAFVAAPQTFGPITRPVQNPDFKEMSRTQLGLGSSLSKVGENGEITYGTMGEAAEKYAIAQYAKGLSIGAQALINDDLNAFVRIPAQMGAKAKSLESDIVWKIITDNAAMADSVALFHASHGNLAGSGAAISIATLGAGRAAVRAQKEMDGEYLNLPVAYLIVPTELETVAEQYISQVQANVQSSNNPFAQGGRTPLSLIVEPRLSASSATAWYLASQLALVDMLELATLTGSQGPEITTEVGFDVIGVKTRVVHSVGAKAIDWRGLYKNPGA